jgi:hypothetical protein
MITVLLAELAKAPGGVTPLVKPSDACESGRPFFLVLRASVRVSFLGGGFGFLIKADSGHRLHEGD